MKKLLTIATAAGFLAFIACGPSEADKKAAEQKKADSTHMADSIKAAQAAMMMKAKADSAAKAHMSDSTKKDSAAK